MKRGVWSEEEHTRFLDAIRHYPEGPWSKIAACIGSRSARQVQTHAQRYYEKVQRHVRGLQRDRSKSTHKEHRIDEDILRLQHLHRIAKSASQDAARARARSGDAPEPDQEPHRRLYRSKDPPPCLQRLTGLPAQQSPVGVNDTTMLSPRYDAPPGYYEHGGYHHPVSPTYGQSNGTPHGLQYARHDSAYSHPPPLPSPLSQRSYPLMPPLGSIAPRLSETRPQYSSYGSGYFSSGGGSPTSLPSPHDSQVITSSIRGVDEHRRPTLTWSQPGLLLPRIFS